MKLNDFLIEALSIYALTDNPTVKKYLISGTDSCKLVLSEKGYIEIDRDALSLNGREDIENNILVSDEAGNIISTDRFKTFIENISEFITRTNHLGISYSCPDIASELEKYKSYLKGTDLKLYEEDSGSEISRWFFIGNISDPGNPLFEVVLTESSRQVVNDWVPHFQIDINTSLTHKALKEKTDDLLSKDFIKWNLNIPPMKLLRT